MSNKYFDAIKLIGLNEPQLIGKMQENSRIKGEFTEEYKTAQKVLNTELTKLQNKRREIAANNPSTQKIGTTLPRP